MKLSLPTIIIIFLICLILPVSLHGKTDDIPFTLVLDAGHGGEDFGAVDNGAKEKDINLGVALQLESLIKKKLKATKVVMTRDKDVYLTLQQRADVANKSKGDLFISIHANSVDKSNKNRKTISGSSVYALGLHKDDKNMQVARRENSVIELESDYAQKYSGFDPSKDESYIIFEMAQKKNLSKSIHFAESVQKELVGIGRGNRGVHQAGFWVLWATSMPAVLVELDFICNPGAADYMSSEKGQKELAQAIFKAIEKYIGASGVSTEIHKDKGKEKEVASKADERSDDEAGVVVGASTANKTKKVVNGTSAKSARDDYASARRRRRSENGKTASDSRNVETASIPLHTDNERTGSVIAAESQKTVDTSSDVSQDSKNKKKKEKKAKQKREKEEKKKRTSNSHNAKIDKFVTVYKIQILASADLLKQNNPRFCGLSPITAYKENNLYKYYYGESTDKQEIDELLKEVKKKIPDAFVISSTKSMNATKN